MDFDYHNPTFKKPSAPAIHKSPSPPKRFIEPLSPHKPSPIEPSFNYPAINDHVDFTVRPEQAYKATPKSKTCTGSHKNTHHRTPSTIDTLAEAALAVSPSHASQPAKLLLEHTHGAVLPHSHGSSEPPHKRSRSELLPSPMVSQYASRPATSYEQGNGWHRDVGQQPSSGHTYDSRLEEASLLLNFRTGGWPSAGPNLLPPPVSTASRPHANSFPQDIRPTELIANPGLLPAFKPRYVEQSRPTLPSPQQTINTPDTSPKRLSCAAQTEILPLQNGGLDNLMASQGDVEVHNIPKQTQTPPDEQDSRSASVDVAVSEMPEAAQKGRRARQKGKVRAMPGRKMEKVVAKRAVTRKKILAGAKSSKNAKEPLPKREPDRYRRKSFDGASASRESSNFVTAEGRRAQSVPIGNPMIIREVKPSRRISKIAAEKTICAGCATTRETSNLNGETDEWVSCNGCKKWFHVDCAGFKKASELRDVDKYFCAACESAHGKTTYVRKSTRAHASVDYAELQRGVLKTSEESQEHHYIQPIKDGSFQFDSESFPRMPPELVTKQFFERSSAFTEPICIPAQWNPRPWLEKRTDRSKEGDWASTTDGELVDMLYDDYEYDIVPDEGQDKLGMVMPEDLTVRQVCNLAGPETPLDVIDVKTQNSGAKWTLARWADYYEEESEDKPIRNVISLEVSHTRLGRLLRRPEVVRNIDLQDQVWPQKELDAGKYPKVQFYCLMSVADSYTDFHIDFGGSSVYYHILKGKKTFFFIPPKAKHLKAYEEWNDSPEQNFTFLPNITKECYRVDLSEGDTMLIPSGWIHAVWTPETSLVVGGNFLTRMSYKNQFKVVEIEKANHTPMKFRYPYFQKIMWYTVLEYLATDPLPEAVSQLFLEGKQFEREVPIWADFDNDIAASDDHPGSTNARYYGEAEIEGLPDLLNYIFRTVMLVNGRIEGISADQQKRINASIPKGHGEPLEVAKTFAIWTAWKRGNEDPPAWAHPDAVLPSNHDEGQPKKLSARALKEMERKEAFAAWKLGGPGRQSQRVKRPTNATTNSKMASSTPDRTSPSNLPPLHQQSSLSPHAHHEMHQHAPVIAQPMAIMMGGLPGAHISTPKTSVLGPKRVACDQCRRRRIRCKHKDLVMQATPGQFAVPPDGFHAQLAPELYDNINVTPPQTHGLGDVFTDHADEKQGANCPGLQNSSPIANGFHAPSLGNNSYSSAGFPMTVNGVAIFGEPPKRGRSKACMECRKSKRRCIHDENGGVDPVKAAETPVPRGSVMSRKRASDEDVQETSLQVGKKAKAISPVIAAYHPTAPHQQPDSNFVHEEHMPAPNGYYEASFSGPEQKQPAHGPYQQTTAVQRERSQVSPGEPDHSSIDPSLFNYQPTTEQNYSNGFSYHSTDRPASYQLPSLEQIANEVLNINDRSHEDHNTASAQNIPHTTTQPVSSVERRPDEGVDSAVSLSGSDDCKQSAAAPVVPNSGDVNQGTVDELKSPISNSLAPAKASPTLQKSSINDLPLYRPPAALSQSPEVSKRPPTADADSSHRQAKRRRESKLEMPSAKKTKPDSSEPVIEDTDSLKLAKLLQQDDLGLRRRSK